MSKLKYPLYAVCISFVLLMLFSLSTEKPRQFRAKQVSESTQLAVNNEILELEVEQTKPTHKAPAPSDSTKLEANTNRKPQEQPPTNIVLAFSENDAGGKIVLTQTRCEKSTNFVAYTTSTDGKIDYGCWSNDELYIVINWEKNGLNNYTFEKFVDMSTKERLKAKHLFDATKEGTAKPLTQPLIQKVTTIINSNGVKK